MRIITIKGVTYVDYQDGSEPVRCDNLYEAFARAFEKKGVYCDLGRKVSAVGASVDKMVAPVKKIIKINIEKE